MHSKTALTLSSVLLWIRVCIKSTFFSNSYTSLLFLSLSNHTSSIHHAFQNCFFSLISDDMDSCLYKMHLLFQFFDPLAFSVSADYLQCYRITRGSLSFWQR